MFAYLFFFLVQIVDPHTVSVNGKLYTAKHILVGVGGRPSMPDIPGIEHVIDSDAALDLPSKPEKIAIVGGGYIALEFAGIFNGFKSEVHVFIRQNKVLRGFDEEVSIFRRATIVLVTDKMCCFFVYFLSFCFGCTG